MDPKPPIKIHGVWQFNNTTDTQCGTSHHQQASTKHPTTGTQITRTKDLYHFRTHRHNTHHHPKLKRVSSSGNQRVPLLGKQTVSEEARTDFSFIPNASVLQTNNGHISKWDQARESELARILMSKSIRYYYQDTSYADPDKGIHVQFNLTDSNITAPFPTHGNNTTTVSHPQPPVPSDHNDWSAIGFSTGLGPKNRNSDAHFHGAYITTRTIQDNKFNELHDRIISDTHFWN
jgi:hypothetical protein